MRSLRKILLFELKSAKRDKWLISYFLFLFALTFILLSFNSTTVKTLISLMDILLIIIPLLSILLGTIYVYNSKEFIVLLLTQPIKKNNIYWGLYLGFVIPYIFILIFAILLPFLIQNAMTIEVLSILFSASLLTLVCSSLAFWIAFSTQEKIKGIGKAIVVWLFAAFLYDGFLLFLSFLFSEYPIEKIMLGLVLINPIDLFRTFFLMTFDISALMGYSGAIFKKFFGTELGVIISLFAGFSWFIILQFRAMKSFNKQDF
jgi:Cu-processing system permease protein